MGVGSASMIFLFNLTWVGFGLLILLCAVATWITPVLSIRQQDLPLSKYLPSLIVLFLLGFGTSFSNTLEAGKALFTNRHWAFKRTPKYAVEHIGQEWQSKKYQVPIDFVAYMEAQDQKRAQEEQQYYEQMQKQQQLRETANNVYNQLVTAYKFTPDEANDFIQKMMRRESLSLDNLVALYKINKSRGAPSGGQTKQPQSRSDIPLPAAVAGGENEPEMDESQQMSASMQAWARRNRWPGSVTPPK